MIDLALVLQTYAVESASSWREWLPVLSFVIPAILLVVLIYLGSKRTV